MTASYVVPFKIIKNLIVIEAGKGGLQVKSSYDSFVDLVKNLLRSVEVDEEWYLKRYPDIKEAIERGEIASARAHFLDNGYFEGRLPGQSAVDAEWYASTYPDVAEGIKAGEFRSAQDHFDQFGYEEGRFPRP